MPFESKDIIILAHLVWLLSLYLVLIFMNLRLPFISEVYFKI